MCIFADDATAENTKLYIGEGLKDGERVHVLGYQNQVASESGPNCMILHFPAAEPMSQDNVIDTSDSVMDDIHTAAQRQFDSLRRTLSVEVFEHGVYDVFLSESPHYILSALQDNLPEEERPEIRHETLKWYENNFPEHTVALCVFDNEDVREPEPMFWWYKPENPMEFHAPAIDSHDGHPPTEDEVEVDHWVITGSYRHLGGFGPVNYSDDIPAEETNLFPSSVMGSEYTGEMPNGDFVIDAEVLEEASRPRDFQKRVERRFP